MASAFDGKFQRIVDHGPCVILVDREFRQCGSHIEQRKGVRRGAQIVACRHGPCTQPVENFQFEAERTVAGIGDLRFDFAEFSRGEADLSG